MEVLPLDRDPAAHEAYYTALVERLRTTPGVASVGLVDYFPLGDGTAFTGSRGSGERVFASVFGALPGYFETIEVALRAGRRPTAADHASGLRGAVINEAAARALFPDGARGRTAGLAGRRRQRGILGRPGRHRRPAAWGPLDDRERELPAGLPAARADQVRP